MVFSVTPIGGMKDIEALEKVPWEDVLSAQSTYELFRDAASQFPDKVAITFLPTGEDKDEAVRISHRQLFARITQAANAFHALGVGPVDAVGILMPGMPQTHFALWGAQTAGIACPINFLLNPEQIAELMNAAGVKVAVVFGSPAMPGMLEKALAVRDLVPGLKALLLVGAKSDPSRNIWNFDEKLDEQPGDALTSKRTFSRRDVCTYFHTGGTTGSPKLARLTQGNMVYAVWAIAQMYGYTPDAIGVNPLPLFHVAGSVILGLSPLCSGAQIIIPTAGGFRNPKALANHWKMVARYRPTHVGGVPANMVAISGVPPQGEDLSSIRAFYTGGAALPVETERYYRDTFGIPVYKMYGMTESTALGAMNPVGAPVKLGCLGMRPPYEELAVRHLNADGSLGAPCGTNETGAVLLRGPGIFAGYTDSSKDAEALIEGGWFKTGDMGYLDEDGELYITGRTKDMINRSGHSIDSGVIEEAIERHPAVLQCAAVGRPDTYAGELPVAYVTLKPGKTADADEIRAFAAANIADPPAVPKDVIILEAMPMTVIGKIFKPELRADQTRRVFQEALADIGATADIQVIPDRKHGNLAVISLQDRDERGRIEAEINRILGGYTVPYEIRWTRAE
ncbi:MAG: acyl-CoA synthetase [Syntrophaceae bacterium]|nr:acyl-CoA synthetase [Syntrophaceae bacterium]